jgi:hypothetical protein
MGALGQARVSVETDPLRRRIAAAIPERVHGHCHADIIIREKETSFYSLATMKPAYGADRLFSVENGSEGFSDITTGKPHEFAS